MKIEVTLKMVDELFDFLESRRLKKKGGGYVLRGVNSNDFPDNLLLKEKEDSPLQEFMEGNNQNQISAKYGLPQGAETFFYMKKRYARQIELYWKFVSVKSFLKPVFDKTLADVFPIENSTMKTIVSRCRKNNIISVGDFVDALACCGIANLKNKLCLTNGGVRDVVFFNIREVCYSFLKCSKA